MRRLLLFTICVISLIAPVELFSEQLTTVAVVDLNKITMSFFTQSQAVRDLQKKADDIRAEIQRQQNEIQQLQQQKLQADQNGDNSTSLQLENEIGNKQQFLQEYRRIKQEELNRQQRNLLQSNSDFYKEMYAAIKYVAESLGYTIVIDTSDQGLQWWAPSVDITQQVIDQLRKSVH